MIFNFACGFALLKVEIMTIQLRVAYVASGITLDVLISALKNTEMFKNDPLPWYCPNCAMEIRFLRLSNKGLKTVLFGGSPKTLAK